MYEFVLQVTGDPAAAIAKAEGRGLTFTYAQSGDVLVIRTSQKASIRAIHEKRPDGWKLLEFGLVDSADTTLTDNIAAARAALGA